MQVIVQKYGFKNLYFGHDELKNLYDESRYDDAALFLHYDVSN